MQMGIQELKQQLTEAYTLNNLNKISVTLINLYKGQQFSTLQKIGAISGGFAEIEITAQGKGFSKLIMLYHPDKLNYYLKEIDQFAEQNNLDGLLGLCHIFKLERIEEIANALNMPEDIDYAPIYDWDYETTGFTIITDGAKVKKKINKPAGYDFYDALKMRQYGHTGVEFPTWYLEDIEEFELSSSDIHDLDGVQFCIHAKTIDVSDNRISDLAQLSGLINLEELNISDNQVGNLDALSNLMNLKRAYLSNNLIEDISPLFDLEGLDYVDLGGNTISLDQISKLAELGIKVDC
jgi:Leucine-rich repeat (LRR) protein